MSTHGSGRSAAVTLVLLLAACTPHPVGPARTEAAYEGKARTTVEEGALSSAQTARLVVVADGDGHATSTYTAVVLSEQEGAIEGSAGTFGSIQPPSSASDTLGDQVDAILADTEAHVRDARIAARRGSGPELQETLPPIETDIEALQHFLAEHPLVKKVLQVTLGILTAIGGFVDMGDLVANAATGARFGMRLAWVIPVGVVGIVVYAEMAGRVAAVSGRPVFELVRERLGPGAGLVNLVASFFINFLTLTAELAGVAIALSLVASVHYTLLIPVVAVLVWLVVWRLPFEWMERVFGLAGLALLVFAVTVWQFGPDWGAMAHDAVPSIPPDETPFTYAYYAIALFGAAMTPYEVFFFSSGAVEEGWGRTDLNLNRANVYIGFPLGGLLSLALMASAYLVLGPNDIEVSTLAQVTLPAVVVIGKLGLAAVLIGVFAATFGAALETALSAGYTVAQYFGWEWGKKVAPRDAARFHLVVLLSILGGALLGLSGVDPVKVTEYSIVLSAAALPLTYFPILVISNDPGYMGDSTNGRALNGIATVYLGLLVVVALAAVPLILITKGGA